MRDLLEPFFAREPMDPVEVARRGMRPKLRQRFYQAAGVEEGDGFCVVLDGKPVRTPGRRVLAAPSRPVAQAIAAEWDAQREVVDPAGMPLTRLANVIIDGVADAPQAVAAEIEKYFGSDLLCYRAEAPRALVERQAEAWDPVIAWAHEKLGARFITGSGVVFIPQPADTLAAARAAIPQDTWKLGAVASITGLTGSALLAIALLCGSVTLDQAWRAAHVDDDWNMEQWGRDRLALERRTASFSEMQAAAVILQSM